MSAVSLRDYERVVFFTGAGMSAESGVPTYRGKGGIWKEYDHKNCASADAFERDPKHVWEFHNYRRELVAACEPNPGHAIVAEAERALAQVTVVTQNIDGLHQLAGSEAVIELHGSLWRTRCDRKRCDAGPVVDRSAPLEVLHCSCGGYRRPDIVWFGDCLDDARVSAAMRAMRDCELLVSVGTSAVVYPAAEMPLVAKKAGAVLVEINPEPTPISDAYDHHMRGPATEMLAQLWAGDAGRGP